MNPIHSFHIPVMGTSYTIDTPVKVAHFGISSVISIVDHKLTEKMREHYSRLYHFAFEPIEEGKRDCRAERITAYLNLVNKIVKQNFESLKQSSFEAGSLISKYFEMLSDNSELKRKYDEMLQKVGEEAKALKEELREMIRPGAIDVNIMTKLDKANEHEKEALPAEFNDAHAALRGFANSELNSSVVLSAGMNPRLFAYMASFDDFFPDEEGNLKKRIILKVSDYRSALIQGKFLAKKGLWVSEFRVESGLNCGGHAFASDGYLMGPILQEFKENKARLIDELFGIYVKALDAADKNLMTEAPAVSFTVQGGVGTAKEHELLLSKYELDAVGWGSPFLLVPEAVTIDEDTMELVRKAKEKDLYLSHVSPLGVPFNTVRNNSGELERDRRVASGKAGFPCEKKYLVSNTEFHKKPVCTASRKYQKRKLEELEQKDLAPQEYKKAFDKIVEKVCLCVGLGNPAELANKLENLKKNNFISVCPGPNAAYFSKVLSLKEMVGHIYGKTNVISRKDRPNLFMKELKMYCDYLKAKIDETTLPMSLKQEKYFADFYKNLEEGIGYYHSLAFELNEKYEEIKTNLKQELEGLEVKLGRNSSYLETGRMISIS